MQYFKNLEDLLKSEPIFVDSEGNFVKDKVIEEANKMLTMAQN